MSKKSNDRADQKNPNNPQHDKVHGNRGKQLNPTQKPPQPTPKK